MKKSSDGLTYNQRIRAQLKSAGLTARGTTRKFHLPTDTLAERFWPHVLKTDSCWIWTRKHDSAGYGVVSVGNNKTDRAHRVAWILTNGQIPGGLFVCHNCPGGDNPRCCNPNHLFLGTQQENLADAVQKGMIHHGENHYASKFTDTDILDMRAAYDAGEKVGSIAKRYNSPPQTISKIVQRIRWKHLP